MEKVGLIAIFDTSQFNKGLKDYLSGVNDVNDASEKGEKDSFNFAHALETFVGNALLQVANMAVDAAKAVWSFGADSVSVASDFQNSLATLQTAASSTGLSMSELGDIAIAVGADSNILGASASGAAEAMTGLYKSGLDTGAIFGDLEGYLAGTAELGGALRASFDLAAATTLDVGQAADLASVALATFGGELETSAEKSDFINGALDNLVRAADASVAEVDGLAQALVYAGPAAADAGYSFEDTTNALAIMSTRGIQASMAGTGLRQMLASLKSPTDKAQDAIDELGLVLRDTTTGELLPLPAIIGNLNEALEGMDAAERDAALGAIFTTNGLAALSPLLAEGVDGWFAMADATETAAGIQEQAALKSQTFAGQMEALDGQLETLQIQLGMALIPALTGLIEILIPIIEQYGPQLAVVFENVGIFLVGLVEAVAQFITESGGLTGIWENIKTAFSENEFIQSIIDKFIEFADTVGPYVKFFVEELLAIWEALKVNAAVIWEGIQTLISGALDIILGVVTIFVGVLSNDWGVLWEGVKQTLSGAWEAITGIIGVALGLIMSLVGTNMEQLGTTIGQLWVIIQVTTQNVWDAIVNFLTTTWDSIKEFATTTFETVKTELSATWEATKALAIAAWEALSTGVKDAMDSLKTWLSTTWDDIKTSATTAWDNLKTAVDEKVTGIKTAVTDVFESIKTFLSGIDLTSMGSNIIQGLIDGIVAAGAGVGTAIGNLVQGAIDKAKNLLGEHSPSKVFAEIGVNTMLGMAGGITAASSVPQQALTSSMDNLISSPVTSTTNNINNSRTANIEINNNGGNGGNTTYYDVVGALGAVGLT